MCSLEKGSLTSVVSRKSTLDIGNQCEKDLPYSDGQHSPLLHWLSVGEEPLYWKSVGKGHLLTLTVSWRRALLYWWLVAKQPLTLMVTVGEGPPYSGEYSFPFQLEDPFILVVTSKSSIPQNHWSVGEGPLILVVSGKRTSLH